jgi:DNA polymerase II small subunit
VVGVVLDLPNVYVVGNPSWIRLHGINILTYHGTSMDALISSLSDLSYMEPEKAQLEYLKKRHVAPVYGKREQIAPEKKDYMVIDSVPDVLHCGHVHRNGYSFYRGVRIINSGTWQSQTNYQLQQGHIPTPCKVPILTLDDMQLHIVNFT